MSFTIRRRLSRPWLAAGLSLAIGALVVVTVVAAPSGGLLPLGNAAVEQAHGTTVQQSAAHPTAAEAVAAATPAAGREVFPALTADMVVAAFDCARADAGLPRYQRDPQLDREAHVLLDQALADSEAHLEPGLNGYTLTGQLLLDGAYAAETSSGCDIGGFDVLQVESLDKSQRIGLAVAPVSQAYGRPLYQVVVVGR